MIRFWYNCTFLLFRYKKSSTRIVHVKKQLSNGQVVSASKYKDFQQYTCFVCQAKLEATDYAFSFKKKYQNYKKNLVSSQSFSMAKNASRKSRALPFTHLLIGITHKISGQISGSTPHGGVMMMLVRRGHHQGIDTWMRRGVVTQRRVHIQASLTPIGGVSAAFT